MRYKLTFSLILFFLILAGDTTFGARIVVWGDQSSAPVGNDFIQVAGGGGAYGNHSLALKSDGSLVAWGYNGYGQCNIPSGNDFVDIAAGEFFSLALKSDGSLVAWGANTGNGWEYWGQCNVPLGNNFVDIACGSRHALAIRSDGSLAAWGRNDVGQCNVPAGNNFVAVAGGMFHSLALKANGSLILWGSTYGWSRRMPSGNDFVAITAGAYYCLALKSNGSLVIWGRNDQGPDERAWYVPEDNDFVDIAGGWQHCLALKSDGSVVAWGSNSYGQIVPQTGDGFVAVACGYEHSLALNSHLPRKIYVDISASGANNGSSWLDAYNHLQDALAVSSSGDEILVAKGFYMPDRNSAHPEGTGDRNATFQLVDGVAIKGGYAGCTESDPHLRNIEIYRTILSGDLNGDDGPNFTNNDENSYHVVYCFMAKREPVLDGITVTGGNANGKSGIEPERYIQGAGICSEKSNPRIINCKIVGNTAKGQYSYGGGISNYGANPTLINCIISCNSAGRRGGGLYNNTGSNPKLVNCTLADNVAGLEGSGLAHLNYSTSILTNCILWNSGTEISGSAITNYCNIKGGRSGEGNINIDPMLSSDGYHLLPDSPCINAGSNMALPADKADLDGDGDKTELLPFDIDSESRVLAGRVDIGADEFNQRPVSCIVGGDRVVEADSNCESRVVLDGSCSSDADSTAGTNDDINDFDWYIVDACDPNYEDYLGSGEVIECNLPLGENIIVLEVTDTAGAFDSNEVTITVEDVTGPEFSLAVEPNVLWPANHEMVLITVEWEVSDNCDDEPEVRLVSITSSEEDDGKGDGATSDDIVIGEDGSIYLRAESVGYLEGRVYTITYEAVDDSGNATIGSAEVLVPDGYRWRHLEHKGEGEGVDE